MADPRTARDAHPRHDLSERAISGEFFEQGAICLWTEDGGLANGPS